VDQYYDILSGAVEQLDDPTGPARMEVYGRIREMLRERLESGGTSLTSRQKTAERLKLERAIRKFESDFKSFGQNAKPATSASTISIDDFERAITLEPALADVVSTRGRVVEALIVRSMRLAASRDRASYFWMIFEPCLQIFGVVFLYWLLGRRSVLDMPALPFAALGCTSWYMFKNLSTSISQGPGAERTLVAFSTVNRFDISLAQALIIGLTYLLVVTLLMAGLVFYEFALPPEDILGFLFWFFVVWINGFAFGLALQPFSIRHLWVRRIYLLLSRFFFIVSGVMFVSEQLLPEYRVYVLWNPLLHLLQLLRSEYFIEYQSADANPSFVLVFTTVMMLAGLAGERSARYRGAPL
jgi:capsular polysaccharide transport system permease protein